MDVWVIGETMKKYRARYKQRFCFFLIFFTSSKKWMWKNLIKVEYQLFAGLKVWLRQQRESRRWRITKQHQSLWCIRLCEDTGSQRARGQEVRTPQSLSVVSLAGCKSPPSPHPSTPTPPMYDSLTTEAGAEAMSNNSFLFNYSNPTTVRRYGATHDPVHETRPVRCEAQVGHPIAVKTQAAETQK